MRRTSGEMGGGACRKCSRGIPIGNVTSQIFANIYLNEFDRFLKHTLKVRLYLRYGDDFLAVTRDRDVLRTMREAAIDFLRGQLHLQLHSRNDVILPCRHGVHFLGFEIFPQGRRLGDRMQRRVAEQLSTCNVASYSGLIGSQRNAEGLREFHWQTLEIMGQCQPCPLRLPA